MQLQTEKEVEKLKKELIAKREAEQAIELRELRMKHQKVKAERSERDNEIK